MRLFTIKLLIFSMFLASCNQKKSSVNEVSILNVSDSLSLFLGLPTSMKLYGDKLFIVDNFDENEMIKIIDTDTKELLFKFAEKGEGPYEFLHIGNIDGYYDFENRFRVNIYDPVSKKIASYDYDSLNQFNEKYEPFIQQLRGNEGVNFHEIIKINDGYLATGMTEDYKYSVLSDSLQIVDYFGAYRSKPLQSIPNTSHVIANYGNSTVSINKDLLVEVIYNASVLTCYDINKKSKKWEYVIHDLDYKMEGKSIINNAPMGYLSASITDRYIYALYSGEEEDLDAMATYGKELHVFDYKGNIIDKYELSKYAFSICVNPQNNELYALSHEPEPKVFIYDLPE